MAKVKCHYEYKGQSYDELADLYPIILGEMERQNSVVQVPTQTTNVVTVVDSITSSPIKEIPVVDYVSFASNNTPTDEELDLARISIESGDFIQGKDLLTKQGKFTVRNFDERTDQLFTLYDKNNSEIIPIKIGKDTMINLVAQNQAYEKYIESTINNEVEEVNSSDTYIDIPTNIADFVNVETISDSMDATVIPRNSLRVLEQYGFDTNDTPYGNLEAILFRMSLDTNGIKEYYSELLTDNITKFKNLELIIDTELPTRGRATILRGATEGDITSIRINPTLITNKQSLAETMLEELTHAIVYSQLRNTNSETVQRLQELHRQAVVAFGEDKLRSTNFIVDKMKDLKTKLQAGINLTEEENAFFDIHKTRLASTGDDRMAYRLNNFDEFIAGVLVDKSFQDFLDSVSISGTNKTLWQRFIDFITNLAEEFGLKNDGILKYALHDSLRLVEESLANTSSIGESLNGKYSRSKNFVYNKLGLKDENNTLKTISNAEEVARFINRSFNNLVAINNPENNTVKIYYRDELSRENLSAIDEYLNSYDPFDFLNDNVPEFIDYYDASGIFDTYADQRDVIKQFGLQTKTYFTNLNDRLNSLFKSRRLILEEPTEEGVNADQANRLERVEREIDVVRGYIKRLTTNDNRLKGLVDLYYQGVDEIEKIDNIMKMNMNSADIKYALQTIKFWKDAKKFVFTPKDYTDTPILDLYNDVEAKAEAKMSTILKALDNYVLNNVVKKHTNFNGTVTDLAKEFVDLSQFRSLIDDLGVTNSTLLNSIASEIKKQNEIRQQELVKKLKHFEEITKQALPSLKNYATDKKDTYEIFRQLDGFGRNTRNIVTRHSYEYQKERKILNFVYDNNSEKTKEEAFNAALFMHRNTEKVNYSALFPRNEEDLNQDAFNSESERLKSIMGSKYFAEWFGKQQKKLEEFKKYREYKISNILDNYNLTDESQIETVQGASEALRIFNEANDPFLLQQKLENFDEKTNPFTIKYNYQNFKYIEDIPKREIIVNQQGKEVLVPGYDTKFSQIEKDDAIYNYYNEIVNILKEINTLVPYETGERLAVNGLPEFKLEMYDMLMDKGMKATWDVFGESMADMIRTEKFDNTNKEIDIVTGKQKQRIRMGVYNSNSAINQEVQNRIFKYKIDNARVPTEDMVEDWRSEITEKYANEMDFNLSKVMQRYIILGMAYKHRSIIEDSLTLSQLMFDGLKEYQRDNKGDLVRDVTNANAVTYLMKDEQNSFVNSKKMLDHTIRSVLFSDTRKVDSGKNRILSPAEKRHKKVLEQTIEEATQAFNNGTIEETDYKFGVENLQRQIDNLGAFADKEKYWDLPLKWTQYKGMGWNIVGGISNMVFGYASNLIESAGAEFYTGEELAKAYNKVILNSSVRNATFNKVNRSEAMKIRNLMDNYDIMAESGSEYKSLIGQDITEKMKWLSAFNVNARTEYVNQAPLMIAMLDKTKFEHEGKEYSLYEAFDENGNWDTTFGAYPEELVRNTVLKIKAIIQRNHGNYNPMAPILAKRNALGRLLLQFRTWMLDGFRTRFFDKDGRYDHILETTIKGRYISAYDVFRNDWKGATLGTALQVIKNILPYSNKYLKNWTPLEKMLEGNENIKDYDIANMRRLAMEINMFIGMYTVILTMSMLAGDWDDDDPRKWAANLLLNQGSRLRSDILMYINPVEAKKLIQDPVPSMKILTDYFKFQDAVKKTVIDGSPEYETGMYKGHNRMLRTGLNMFPLVSQPYRTGSNVWQVFDQK